MFAPTPLTHKELQECQPGTKLYGITFRLDLTFHGNPLDVEVHEVRTLKNADTDRVTVGRAIKPADNLDGWDFLQYPAEHCYRTREDAVAALKHKTGEAIGRALAVMARIA